MVEVPLTRGFVAIIDDEDAETVLALSWRVTLSQRQSTPYAITSTPRGEGPRRTLFLHRFIIAPPPELLVDHKDGNGLNCRRSNLRVATPTENAANCRRPVGAAGFRGVVKPSPRNPRWSAQIQCRGKYHFLGAFDAPEEAARAYDDAALRLFGEFSVLNFPAEAK